MDMHHHEPISHGQPADPAIGRRAAMGAIGAAALAFTAGNALGQSLPQRKSRGRNVGMAPGEILTKHPIDKRDWTLTTQVRLFGFKQQLEDFNTAAVTTNIRLDAVAAMLPLILGSAMHEGYPDKA